MGSGLKNRSPFLMAKKALSYVLGGFLGLLIIAPPINYEIPLLINSFHWLYMICAAGFFGFLLWKTNINIWLKVLSVFLFISCFFSQAPALSFNAYALCVFALYLLWALKHCDFKIVVRFIEAAFWFEVFLGILQMLGKDVLLSFSNRETVFMGTMMQYMRCASVILCMAPFLLWKSKLYLIPLLVIMVFSKSSTFAVCMISGCSAWLWFECPELRKWIVLGGAFCIGIYAFYDFGSWQGAIAPSNGGRLITWVAVVKTWLFDLSLATPSSIWKMNGPFNLQWFFVGHGMDTFLPLFPIYKHDLNPFPQAHNDWLQMMWETGIISFGLVSAYLISLIKKLLNNENYLLLAGLVIIGVDAFFAFPMRMTQTMFLMVAYCALCERKLRWTRIKLR